MNDVLSTFSAFCNIIVAYQRWEINKKDLCKALIDAKIGFIRSQDALAVDDSEATGLKLTPSEALDIFGIEKLIEIADYWSAVIVRYENEPAETFKKRREFLDFSQEQMAKLSGVTLEELQNAENSAIYSSIHTLIKIAKALGLDTRFITWKKGNPQNGYLY